MKSRTVSGVHNSAGSLHGGRSDGVGDRHGCSVILDCIRVRVHAAPESPGRIHLEDPHVRIAEILIITGRASGGRELLPEPHGVPRPPGQLRRGGIDIPPLHRHAERASRRRPLTEDPGSLRDGPEPCLLRKKGEIKLQSLIRKSGIANRVDSFPRAGISGDLDDFPQMEFFVPKQ
jgi:hypothetical protein